MVLNKAPKRVTVGRWGYVPPWAADEGSAAIINARAETVADKPAFRDALAHRRCLVLADSFFEWRSAGRTKVPYRILLKSGEPFAFAGIWQESGDGVPGFAIITTPANQLVANIHDRMPVILAQNGERPWLEDRMSVVEAQVMLRQYEAAAMDAYPVSTMVNAPANDTAMVVRRAA